MFCKFAIALAVVLSVDACPAAKKASLQQEEINDYQRVLTEITGQDSRKLASVVSPMNAPQCLKPGFVLASRKSGAAALPDIKFVFNNLQVDFYQLIDSIINGKLTGAPVELNGADPSGLGAPGLGTVKKLFNGGLNIQQQMWRVANILGNAARLAFHDAGEVDITTVDKFGSDGCLSDSGPNSGLKEVNTVAMTIIEPLWQKYCDKISRADFWVLFAKIALESGLTTGRFDKFVANLLAIPPLVIIGQNPNPYLDLPFQYGRLDAVGNCDAGQNRLPGHQPGLVEFERVYVRNMGLHIRDGLILSGAHSVGHVHTQFSGFGHPDNLPQLEQLASINAWDESPWIFDNLYYASVVGEFWLNNVNTVNANVIPNLGGTANSLPAGSIPSNAGTNFWAVQVAPGLPQQFPACAAVGLPLIPGAPAIGAAPTCGITPLNQIFCTYQGVTHTGPVPNPRTPAVLTVGTLGRFASADPLNPCNCVSFFAVPSTALPANCALAPHPKTIMLNADMVQNFPISTEAGAKNLISTPSSVIGAGLVDELCGPIVTNLASQAAPRPPIFNTNQAVNNTNLVFPAPVVDALGNVFNQGFGCVDNLVGNAPNLGLAGVGNVQSIHSSLLPKDSINNAVSLWATMNSLMDVPLGGCLEGISTYNGLMNPYGGSIKNPLPVTSFVGNNAAATCTDPTPAFGNGRDNFYREFEIAFTKMTTVGFTYSHTFLPPTITTFTDTVNGVVNNAINGIAVFRNPLNGNRVVTAGIPMVASGNGKMGTLTDANLGSSTCLATYPNPCVINWSLSPTGAPTVKPTQTPITATPSSEPSTRRPSMLPSVKPTRAPITAKPTASTRFPSRKPTRAPR